MSCCCKTICAGCEYANCVCEQEAGLKHTCPFCRHPMANSEEEANRTNVKRAESSNDPAAIHRMGANYESAFEYFYTKAARLGSGCRNAVNEFRKKRNITTPMVQIEEKDDKFEAVWWQKE
eukprot:scaffold1673_cov99-Skeletonema_dohrnii-CCMP3373.AAC.3